MLVSERALGSPKNTCRPESGLVKTLFGVKSVFQKQYLDRKLFFKKQFEKRLFSLDFFLAEIRFLPTRLLKNDFRSRICSSKNRSKGTS